MAINQANIKAVITAEDKASSVLKGFGSQVDTTAKSATGSLDKLNTSFLAVTASTAGLVLFGKKSLDAFNQQDLAITRLRAGIKNVASATDKNVDGLIRQAAALQKVTRFSDEQIISAQGILATDQLNQKAIEKLTPRLLDMAEGLAHVSGEMPDLESNAALVAKAIGGEDTDSLVGVLRRANVLLTKHQIELLKSGTVEQRISTITEALDQNFKGLAESAGTTTAGKIAILKNNFNDLEEKVGQVIATGLNPLLNILNKHPKILAAVTLSLGALAAAFIAVKVAAAIGTVMNAAAVAISGVGVAAGATTAAFGSMLTVLANPVVLAVAGALADLVLVYKAVQSVTGAFRAMRDAANSATAAEESNRAASERLAAAADKGKISLVELDRTQKQLGFTSSVYHSAATGGSYLSGYAEGTDYASPGWHWVGENGPELMRMNGGETVKNSRDSKGAASTININVNAGALMGTDIEARKFAKIIFGHLQDIAGAKSMTVGELLS